MVETLIAKKGIPWGGALKSPFATRQSIASGFYYEDASEGAEEVRDSFQVDLMRLKNVIVHRYDLSSCFETQKLWHAILCSSELGLASQASRVTYRVALDPNLWSVSTQAPAIGVFLANEGRTEPLDVVFALAKFAAKLRIKPSSSHELQGAGLVSAIDNYALLMYEAFPYTYSCGYRSDLTDTDPVQIDSSRPGSVSEVVNFVLTARK